MDIIICQNPPGLPALAVCHIVSKIRSARFIIDWHNYSYTILALSLADSHSFTKFTHRWEDKFGKRAHLHICVSEAMRRDLVNRWRMDESLVTVLYDRPGPIFQHSFPIQRQHDMWCRLATVHKKLAPKSATDNEGFFNRVSETIFTSLDPNTGHPILKPDRPAIVISSTSWTPDEDFQCFIDALQIYNNRVEEERLPKLFVVITGKGPLKEHFSTIMSSLSLAHIRFLTPWLDPADYPVALASADIGVCLHSSSSALDLPMKVVDMLGVGLPVLAYHYGATIEELVLEGRNGTTFKNAGGLADSLAETLVGFPEAKVLEKYRQFNEHNPVSGWDENWDSVMWPLISPT